MKATRPDKRLGLLERCRQLCQSYGLLPTGHIANDAEAYLTAVKSRRITDDLASVLAEKDFSPAETQFHKLLEQPAPTLRCWITLGRRGRCRSGRGGAVVVVFYYGYGCSHCVARSSRLNKDLKLFHELGAEIVAIGSDPPEHTTEKYKEYGPFDFPRCCLIRITAWRGVRRSLRRRRRRSRSRWIMGRL